MNKSKLAKYIEELEVLIKESEQLIGKAHEAADSMDEPYKSQFLESLAFMEVRLNNNKVMLTIFKAMMEAL